MHYTNYHESKQRGTSDFPIEFYHVTPLHPQFHMRIHWHMEFEFIYVWEGSLLLSIDEQEYLLPAGTVAFIPSGSLHAGVPQDDCVYDCVVFDPNMLIGKSDTISKYIHKISKQEWKLPFVYGDENSPIVSMMHTLFQAISMRQEGYQLVVQGILYQFFGTTISQEIRTEPDSRTTRDLRRIMQLKNALEYIENNYTSPITLQDISNCAHMTPKYFCRFFREMTQRTPIDYVNYYRIERACHLLLTTNQSITEIAYNTGFNDLSYFIKIFKQYKGITPKQYLK